MNWLEVKLIASFWVSGLSLDSYHERAMLTPDVDVDD